ncbi:MAG: hypothetical protein ABEH43_09075 [Flavobacteriales bacterium]
MKQILTFTLVIFSLFFMGCDGGFMIQNGEVKKTSKGCWYILSPGNNVVPEPESFPDKYKEEGLKVKLDFDSRESFPCTPPSNKKFEAVFIKKIKKKN